MTSSPMRSSSSTPSHPNPHFDAIWMQVLPGWLDRLRLGRLGQLRRFPSPRRGGFLPGESMSGVDWIINQHH